MDNNNNFLNTTKGNALLKLFLWAIFIIILVVLTASGNNDGQKIDKVLDDGDNKQSNEVGEAFKNYEDMINDILRSNYEFNYEITRGEELYKYSGYKCDNKYLGYREDTMGITKYYINENSFYKILLNEVEPIEDLYTGFDGSYLDLNMLFENLNSYLYRIEKDYNKRTITYNKEGYQVVVNTDTSSITGIVVTTEDTSYNLEYIIRDYCKEINISE